MSNLFKPSIPATPAPIQPPPMPDPNSPTALNAAKTQAAQRNGRQQSILSMPNNRGTLGAGVPYSGSTLGGTK